MKKLILLVVLILTGCCKAPQSLDTYCHNYKLVKFTDKEAHSKDIRTITYQRIYANNQIYLKLCVDEK